MKCTVNMDKVQLFFTSLVFQSCVNSTSLHVLGSSGLMVKDEYDYDCPSSLPSSDGHIQTIQHPPSRPMPEPPFSSPALLPPAEGSSSASTSAFSSISVGSSCKSYSFDPISYWVGLLISLKAFLLVLFLRSLLCAFVR